MFIVPYGHCFDRRDFQPTTVPQPVADRAEQALTAPALCCVRCGHAITDATARLAVQGRHVHFCSNPLGIEFQIGCFRWAPGLVGVGELSDFWTWFPGYCWRVGLCGRCELHLGWCFTGEEVFYGLILDRLREVG